MSLRRCVVMTSAYTSVRDTIDEERRPGGVALAGGYTHASIVLTASHTIVCDDDVTRTLAVDTQAVLGDGTDAIDLSAHCYVTYVDPASVFTCCRQENLTTVAAGLNLWPLHYVHAPEIVRYQSRAPRVPLVVLLAGVVPSVRQYGTSQDGVLPYPTFVPAIDSSTLPLYGSNQRLAMDEHGKVIMIDDQYQAFVIDPANDSPDATPFYFDLQHGDGVDVRCLGIAYDTGQYQGAPGLWTALVTLTYSIAKPTTFTFAEDWTAGGMLTGLTPGSSVATTMGGTLYSGVWAGDGITLHLELWCNDFTATAAQLDSVTWNGSVLWTGTLALPITNSIGVHAHLDVHVDAALTATPFLNTLLLGVHVTPGETHFDNAFGAILTFTADSPLAETFRTLVVWQAPSAPFPYWRSGRIVAQPDERWGFVGPPLDLSFFDVTYDLDGTPLTLTTHLSSYQYRLALGPVHRLVDLVDTTFSLEISTGEGHTYGELGINVLPDGTLKLAPFAAQMPNEDIWSGGSDWPLVEFWVKEDGTLFGAPTFAITRVWHYTPEPSIVLGPGCGGTVLLGTQDGDAVVQSHTLLRDNWNDFGYDTLTRSLPYVLNTITGLRVRLQWPMHEYTNYFTMGGVQPYPDFRLNTDLVVSANVGSVLRDATGFYDDPAHGGDGTYAPSGSVLPVRFNGAGTRVAFSGGGAPIWPGPTAPAWINGVIVWPTGHVETGTWLACCSDGASGVYALSADDRLLYYSGGAGSALVSVMDTACVFDGDRVPSLQLSFIPPGHFIPDPDKRGVTIVHGQDDVLQLTTVSQAQETGVRTIAHLGAFPWLSEASLSYDRAHTTWLSRYTAAACAFPAW